MSTAQPTTFTLPMDVMQALDAFSRKEGLSQDEIVGQAVRHHLFLQQFRTLQEKMTTQARDQGILTDQDVFDRIS